MTIDTILQELQEKLDKNIPIAVGQYLDYAVKLNLLLLELDDTLVKAEMVVNREKASLMEKGATAAHAGIVTKAMPEYEALLLLKARKEHIVELVRIAKQRTQVPKWEV